MLETLLVFLGAGLGGVLRYWISIISNEFFGRDFPYGTLIVNVSGCFLMGLLFILLLGKSYGHASALRSLILIGFLGGYTTFSSFSIETLTLFESGAAISGLTNIISSVLLALIATWLGVMLGKYFI